VPRTCEELGAECGTIGNGCSGLINCGTCAAPETCGGGGIPNQCGCTPRTCVGTDCTYVGDDGCGGTLDCTCEDNQRCIGTVCQAVANECGSGETCASGVCCGGVCCAPGQYCCSGLCSNTPCVSL
jgi:hypothetical protein